MSLIAVGSRQFRRNCTLELNDNFFSPNANFSRIYLMVKNLKFEKRHHQNNQVVSKLTAESKWEKSMKFWTRIYRASLNDFRQWCRNSLWVARKVNYWNQLNCYNIEFEKSFKYKLYRKSIEQFSSRVIVWKKITFKFTSIRMRNIC